MVDKDSRVVSYTMEDVKNLEPRWSFEKKLNQHEKGVKDRVPISFADQEEDKVILLAPFGPPMAYCKMPSDLIKTINDWVDAEVKDVKQIDWSGYLVGKTSEEFSFTREIMEKICDFLDPCFKEFDYFRVQRQNKNHHPDIITEVDYNSAWIVRSFAGDFNPLHLHTNCNVSCIGYTKLPEEFDEEWKKDYEDHYPCVGMTEFMHEKGSWAYQGGFILKPSVGDFIIFPAELQHMAYPFKSKGERRTFSINASFIYNLKEGSSWDKIQQDSVDSQISPTSVQYGAKK